jgi:hypothetical protein|tara:strand:+ start:447 stop:683 length:237 start_codon:yes stop_codon:yes gene_type:complete
MRDDIVDVGDMVRVTLDENEDAYLGLIIDITDDGESIGSYITGEYEDYYDYSVLFFGETSPMCVYSSEIVEIVSKVAS